MTAKGKVRLVCAFGAALAGPLTGAAMLWIGGSLASFLPPPGLFLIAATFGAASSGFALAPCVGRVGTLGEALGVVAAVAMTVVGAMIGAALVGLIEGPLEAMYTAPLGLLAVGDAITTSATVALVWCASMLGSHLWTREIRGVTT